MKHIFDWNDHSILGNVIAGVLGAGANAAVTLFVISYLVRHQQLLALGRRQSRASERLRELSEVQGTAERLTSQLSMECHGPDS